MQPCSSPMLLVSADVALELLILLWVLRCVHARQ